MENGKFTISVKVDEDMANKYNAYKATYINDKGGVEEVIDANEKDGYITFETSHLSTYSVLGYNATTTEVQNPQTYNGIMNYAFIGLLSIVGLAGTALYLKRNFN